MHFSRNFKCFPKLSRRWMRQEMKEQCFANFLTHANHSLKKIERVYFLRFLNARFFLHRHAGWSASRLCTPVDKPSAAACAQAVRHNTQLAALPSSSKGRLNKPPLFGRMVGRWVEFKVETAVQSLRCRIPVSEHIFNSFQVTLFFFRLHTHIQYVHSFVRFHSQASQLESQQSDTICSLSLSASFSLAVDFIFTSGLIKSFFLRQISLFFFTLSTLQLIDSTTFVFGSTVLTFFANCCCIACLLSFIVIFTLISHHSHTLFFSVSLINWARPIANDCIGVCCLSFLTFIVAATIIITTRHCGCCCTSSKTWSSFFYLISTSS